MKVSQLLFLALSFLSQIGDAIFLTGLPLFFYKESGGSIFETSYVALAIVLTVFLSKKLIIQLNQNDPLKLTAYGEITMAVIELVVLGLYFTILPSRWLVLAAVLPLAFVYNLYVPAKYFQIYKFFFSKNDFFLSSIQSLTDTIGTYVGIAISGLIVLHFSIYGVLIIDSISFLIFGFAILAFKNIFKPENLLEEPIAHSENEVEILGINKSKFFLVLFLFSLGKLFLNWETSISIALFSKVTNFNISYISQMRGVFGAVGLGLGIVIGKYQKKESFVIWLISLILIFIFGMIFGEINENFGFSAFYLFAGLYMGLSLPLQRYVYKRMEMQKLPYQKIMSKKWVYDTILSLNVVFVAYISDLAHLEIFNVVQISFVVLVVLGVPSAVFANYLAMKE